LFKGLSQKFLWFIVTFWGYLGYLTEVRPFFSVNYGAYSVGFMDCLIVVVTLISSVFYLLSIVAHKKW
jgi:hypothetical protein